MKDPLVRFGVAIENSLLRQLDALVAERGGTRSELLRDLARGEVGRMKAKKGVEAVSTLTLVYNHHVRDLSERLTALQHELGEGVRAALHVHLTQDLCLEVVVMRGKSDRLQAIANRILAMRGVKHGGIEIIPTINDGPDEVKHDHEDHDHDHDHRHDDLHPHSHAHHSHGIAVDLEAAAASAQPRRAPRSPARAKAEIRSQPPRRGRPRRG